MSYWTMEKDAKKNRMTNWSYLSLCQTSPSPVSRLKNSQITFFDCSKTFSGKMGRFTIRIHHMICEKLVLSHAHYLSINRSNQLINQSTNESSNTSINQSTNQAISYSVIQSINRLTWANKFDLIVNYSFSDVRTYNRKPFQIVEFRKNWGL